MKKRILKLLLIGISLTSFSVHATDYTLDIDRVLETRVSIEELVVFIVTKTDIGLKDADAIEKKYLDARKKFVIFRGKKLPADPSAFYSKYSNWPGWSNVLAEVLAQRSQQGNNSTGCQKVFKSLR